MSFHALGGATTKYGELVARLALAALFVASGLNILLNFTGTAGYYASLGLPFATLVVVLVLLVKTFGTLALIFNIHAREGALALLIFTLLATLVAHTGEGQLINALKNVAIMGGLLMVMVHGGGRMMDMQKHCVCPKCKGKGGSQTCTCGVCDNCRADAQS